MNILGGSMGKVLISLSDDVERKFRELARKLYGDKKGALSIACERAIIEWIKKHEEKQ